jgi:hypothetical protein
LAAGSRALIIIATVPRPALALKPEAAAATEPRRNNNERHHL